MKCRANLSIRTYRNQNRPIIIISTHCFSKVIRRIRHPCSYSSSSQFKNCGSPVCGIMCTLLFKPAEGLVRSTSRLWKSARPGSIRQERLFLTVAASYNGQVDVFESHQINVDLISMLHMRYLLSSILLRERERERERENNNKNETPNSRS